VVTEVGAAGILQGVVVADDVLGRTTHEGDLLTLVERNAADGPQQVVSNGGHPVLALEAKAEVVVGADVVVLQEGDEPGGVAVDPVISEYAAYTAIVPTAQIIAEGGEEAEVEH
jgi:hypothetical protein